MNEVVVKVIGNYSYQTSRCLGEGVYGKVYEGVERQSKEKVAIKKIDLAIFTNDKYLENAIFSQIYLLKRFNHPNVVKFKDVLSSKNSLYIITEFCKNGDLKEAIKRKRIKEQQAFEIMRQLLSGFTELVRQKIIHRDLKPANILISDGVYKIGDFGFAKYVDNFGSQMLKSCVGSPIYMAPQILERTNYSTKCDIWSLGVIFYEMIHGYPPWKARDEPELLRGIRSISISHILKKSSLSSRGNDFLKKTLAYSEEERIGWNQLFESFCQKPQKMLQSENKYTQSSSTKEKERNRVISANSPANLTSWNHNNIHGKTTPINTTNPINRNNSRSHLNTVSSDKRKHLFSGENISSEKKVHNYDHSNSQLEIIKLWRQYCVYYHFYFVELMLNFNFIVGVIHKTEMLAKLLLSLALLTKNKSTYCLTLVNVHAKGANKFAEELQKKMKQEHEFYEQAYNDITSMLQKLGLHKALRSEITATVGHSQVINEDRIDKLQNYMLGIANENIHGMSDQAKRRVKTLKEFTLVEVLDYLTDIINLGLNKGKGVKELNEEKNEEEDVKDYVTKVINKADRLVSNM